MADLYELEVSHGRIVGKLASSRNQTTVRVYWDVPKRSREETDHFVTELAADPLLAGRWSSGRATEEDRLRAGATEDGWSSFCDCGMKQPCRHAQSLLFQFRYEAKRDPWLWFEVSAGKAETIREAVRAIRAALVRRGKPAPAITHEMLHRAKLRALERAKTAAMPWVLRGASDPAFWNRDMAFVEWLRPMMAAVREKEEHDDA